ncbi:hypothetical protein PR048_015168 [Dryococelus australis]|uniref:Uncharacterized protein n=1 Tax=Dryococelus australis TaxID=614101 RepID=A0ABQ9HGC6_9NEOP|nr:hypothetical protein PR048_015168 [Dryococelus australis]
MWCAIDGINNTDDVGLARTAPHKSFSCRHPLTSNTTDIHRQAHGKSMASLFVSALRCPVTENSGHPMRGKRGEYGAAPELLRRGRETGDHRENPPNSDIVGHESTCENPGVTPPRIERGSPRWEASCLTATPPRPPFLTPPDDSLARCSEGEFDEFANATHNVTFILPKIPQRECVLAGKKKKKKKNSQAKANGVSVKCGVRKTSGRGRIIADYGAQRVDPASRLRVNDKAASCATHGSATRYGGNTARLALRSDEALGVRESVARIVPSLFDRGREALERKGGGNVRPRENPPTYGIVWQDYHMRKSGVTRPGIAPRSPWWEASGLTAQPPVEDVGHRPIQMHECAIKLIAVAEHTTPPSPFVLDVPTLMLSHSTHGEITWQRVRLVLWPGNSPPTTGEPGSIPVRSHARFLARVEAGRTLLGGFSGGAVVSSSFAIPSLLRLRLVSSPPTLSAGIKRRRETEILEKTRPPAASCGTSPTCENPGATPPRIEPGSPSLLATSIEVDVQRDLREEERGMLISAHRFVHLICEIYDKFSNTTFHSE